MLKTIEAATGRPVSMEQAKEHCRAAEFDDDDDQIETFLDAAIEFVQTRIGLTLAPTVYRIDRCGWWGGCLNVLVAPVRDVVSIKYFDANGDQQTVSPVDYRWVRTQEGARIELLSTFTSPALEVSRNDAVRIEIEAGFDAADPVATGSGDDPELIVPNTARQAILMLTSYWYDNRDAVSSSDAQRVARAVPLGAEALMAQLRVYR